MKSEAGHVSSSAGIHPPPLSPHLHAEGPTASEARRPLPGLSFPGHEEAPLRLASIITYCHQLSHHRVASQLIQIKILMVVVYVVGETNKQTYKQTNSDNVGTLVCRDLI